MPVQCHQVWPSRGPDPPYGHSRYSKLELAKKQAIKELEDEYGVSIDEILESGDDTDQETNEPTSRQDTLADEEAAFGEAPPEQFDDYTDPNGSDVDPYSYEGIQFSGDEDDGA